MNQVQKRSTFVTVLAWIFIALAGFSTVISILQNVMVYAFFSGPKFAQAMAAPGVPAMPPFFSFMASHAQLFFMTFLAVSVFALVSSVGLLKRWNWARLCFVGLMILAIAWQVVGVVLQVTMFSSMQRQFSSAAMHGGPDMEPFFIVAAIFGILFALGFSILFGWLAKRLLSPSVASEFCR